MSCGAALPCPLWEGAPPSGVEMVTDYSARVKVMVKVLDFVQLYRFRLMSA